MGDPISLESIVILQILGCPVLASVVVFHTAQSWGFAKLDQNECLSVL